MLLKIILISPFIIFVKTGRLTKKVDVLGYVLPLFVLMYIADLSYI